MRNPFAQPRTTGQWLLGSVCWTVVCVGGWLLADHLLVQGYPVADDKLNLALGCFGLAHVLIWWRVVAKVKYVAANSIAADLLVVLAFLWWLVLLVFQLASLPLVLLWYGCQSEAAASSPPWLQF